jgi:hypothetical protein
MNPIRDSDLAQQYVLQGILLQRAVAPHGRNVRQVLEWALEILSGGQPLPPVGFVADLGHAIFGLDQESRPKRDFPTVNGFPSTLARTYEDRVLGKLYADWTFERASDAMRRYTLKERPRGLAYFVKQMRERGQFDGLEFSPGIVRSMLDLPPEEILRRGWQSVETNGLFPALPELYQSLIDAARRMAEVLAPEDVIALEQKTALADLGQYVAHRQVLQIARRLDEGLPRHKVKPLAGRQEVPTRVLDEDTYPVGGFSSISNKGSIESLLHSQLAYMERDPNLQPDLFDIKYVRDELYYYSRDENQFLRRRRSFVFAFYPDLVKARFKDHDLPCQRIVLLLGLLLTGVRKLSEWLSTDALRFEFVFVQEADQQGLHHEKQLLEMLLREQIANGTVFLHTLEGHQLSNYCGQRAQRSLCHCLAISSEEVNLEAELTLVTGFQLNAARPQIQIGYQPLHTPEADDPVDSWILTLEELLRLWV